MSFLYLSFSYSVSNAFAAVVTDSLLLFLIRLHFILLSNMSLVMFSLLLFHCSKMSNVLLFSFSLSKIYYMLHIIVCRCVTVSYRKPSENPQWSFV